MNKVSYELSIIAYYLSAYDMKAVNALGYRTWTDAFRNLSARLGRPNNYLKLRRDEFDVLTDSPRHGWANRKPTSDVVAIFKELSPESFEELTSRVLGILNKTDEQCKEKIEEAVEDSKYVGAVNHAVETYPGKKVMRDKPAPAGKLKGYTAQTYLRDPVVAANALCNAEYKCEVCAQHETFIRKSSGKPYTEPHHLIPMKYQPQFNVSLDVENNIVSLCSNCHNRLHYGVDICDMLRKLYNARKELLSKAGIDIAFEKLEELYK